MQRLGPAAATPLLVYLNEARIHQRRIWSMVEHRWWN
jgi:hypothetical protein